MAGVVSFLTKGVDMWMYGVAAVVWAMLATASGITVGRAIKLADR